MGNAPPDLFHVIVFIFPCILPSPCHSLYRSNYRKGYGNIFVLCNFTHKKNNPELHARTIMSFNMFS